MKYKAVVVGAGPAGIAVVGNLLEQHQYPLLWVDDSFEAGRLRCYRQVPSNTRVKLFVGYAAGVPAFRRIAQTASTPNAISALKELDQEATCTLSEAADMCLMLTKGLESWNGVTTQSGRVSDASWADAEGWVVGMDVQKDHSRKRIEVLTELLVLCTGSSPAKCALPTENPQSVDLDVALNPTRLAEILPAAEPTVIAVIGASHSAILVLMNLCSLASTSHASLRIKWFTRHSLRYAEERNGWTFRDNTGLKGEAAAWAKANLEPGSFRKSVVAGYVEKIATTAQSEYAEYERHLPSCTHVVQAIGYRRDTQPVLRVRGVELQCLEHNSKTGGFQDNCGSTISGLYGAGIAWPERVVDPEGNVEYAVGLAKFMRFLNRVAPKWASLAEATSFPFASNEKQCIETTVSLITSNDMSISC